MKRFSKAFFAAFAIVVTTLVACHPRSPAPGTNEGAQSRVPTKLGAACMNNLRLIETAKKERASEHQKTANDPAPSWNDLGEYVGRGSNNNILPGCPSGGVYTIGQLDEPAKCSLTPEQHTHERQQSYNAKQSQVGH